METITVTTNVKMLLQADKIIKVINSCKTITQLQFTVNMLKNWTRWCYHHNISSIEREPVANIILDTFSRKANSFTKK